MSSPPLYQDLKKLSTEQLVFPHAARVFRVVRKLCEFDQDNNNLMFVHKIDTAALPDYTQLIASPMCLDDICAKFVELKYSSDDQVFADLTVSFAQMYRFLGCL
jgi:hypothetical protein